MTIFKKSQKKTHIDLIYWDDTEKYYFIDIENSNKNKNKEEIDSENLIDNIYDRK